MNLTSNQQIIDDTIKSLQDSAIFPITQNISAYPSIGVNSFVIDETVRGEMISTQIIFSQAKLAQMNMDEDTFKQFIKKELAIQLAEQIIENKLVEFTKQENFNTCEIAFRARAYLTPDNQVRMLRKASK